MNIKYTDEYLKSIKYHHLTFLRRLPSEKCIENGKRQGLWKCDCGKEIPYKIYDVIRGNKQSCGCINFKGNKSWHWKGCGELTGLHWWKILRGAKSRKHKVKITIEDAWNQFLKQDGKCALTGEKLCLDYKKCSASLDRVDSNKDYLIDNIQWVHININMMKHRYSQDEFILWCNKVAEHNKSNA